MENITAKKQELNKRWRAERDGIVKLKMLIEEVEMVTLEIDQSECDFDINRVAELKYYTAPPCWNNSSNSMRPRI